jgi:hypothetical protein
MKIIGISLKIGETQTQTMSSFGSTDIAFLTCGEDKFLQSCLSSGQVDQAPNSDYKQSWAAEVFDVMVMAN